MILPSAAVVAVTQLPVEQESRHMAHLVQQEIDKLGRSVYAVQKQDLCCAPCIARNSLVLLNFVIEEIP